MTVKEIFRLTDGLKEQLLKLQPLKKEDEDRLWKKFRLEWNYNSNHIEGNTLTYGHTELLLIFDKISGDYTGREIEEMKAHDVAIKLVDELAQDKERPLTETFINQLNDIILVRPFWKEAITSDGQPTRRLIEPGKYKKYPNSVRLENGELFNYASPEETPAMMGDLMDFYKKHDTSTETHPVWLAAILHYKFVCIHPFDDGNGRLSRLLMNYVLLKNNYPPVIIKSKNKNEYLMALNKADTGDLESFVIYIGEQLKWSLELAIKAAEGKSVDEQGDLDKKITLLKQTLNTTDKIITKKKSVIQNVVFDFYIPFISHLQYELKKFEDFFETKSWSIVDRNSTYDDPTQNTLRLLVQPREKMSFNEVMDHIGKIGENGTEYGYEVVWEFERFNSEDLSFDFGILVDLILSERNFHVEVVIGNLEHLNKTVRKAHHLMETIFKTNQKEFIEMTFDKINYNQKLNKSLGKSLAKEIANLSYTYIEKEVESLEKRRREK